MIHTVIVDDHVIVREGFKRIIQFENDIDVTGECGDADEVMRCLRSAKCDVLVLDIEMPGRSGLDLIPDIKTEFPDVKILIQSVLPQEYLAVRALKVGAAGYISKDSAADELVRAIRKVYTGRRFVSSVVYDQLVSDVCGKGLHAHEKLSKREFEVMRLIASGEPTQRIAESLSLSTNTVNTYRKRILEKLELESTTELIHYAVRNKLVQ